MARRAGLTTRVASNPWHAGLVKDGISEEQQRLLSSWLGPFEVISDHSWPMQDTTVLQLGTPDGGRFIVKASQTSHHVRREIAAYSRGMPGLEGRVPSLVHASTDARLLVTRFLPGILVAGSPAEHIPDTYRQAGALLARLHSPAGVSRSYMRSLAARTRAVIGKAQGLLAEDLVRRLTEEVAAVELSPVELVTSHGDYQPRNWLYDDGEVKVIDFGRADLRPWVHDLVRLTHQQFLADAALATAFQEGLGRAVTSPEEVSAWRLENLDQAVGTVVWAHSIGDESFEQQGVAMVERVLTMA
ncbi:aminoglycoside phosphotransferase family protein [Arthrobacter sp. fls2-241-R2A-172]|uniref:phosphotransferase family protein n=1 Tax=Arthrobacter sp. fls2-241-R2A-172 TaxID=3040325 RepID=UPI00254B2AC4|nr:aminoglycoside phosphotransferase family protein [Arthrobacter sp. fls2-241-R2A-172]